MIDGPLIECVPNFSEGRDMQVIKQITDEIQKVEGVRLLDVDPGKATNRTVVTFVGSPDAVVEAAFLAIKKAAEVIDMSHHKGEHPRMGATDVCPLIPIANITMQETALYARKLAEKVGANLPIPIYLYEYAATSPQRKNLATVRAGEYEGLPQKLSNPDWKPDFGPSTFNPKAGATAIGARDFLVAYNVNLNTKSERRANSVAFDVREKGRISREGDPITGKIITDDDGNPSRTEGMCKAVKAIGWYIEEYGIAQISMNLTDINITPLHIAFEACRKSAFDRGLRVTGSELVGLVPKKVLLDAGKYFLQKQGRSTGVDENEIIHIAVKSLGLDELTPFDPDKKIIERLLEEDTARPLIKMNLAAFTHQTASESPAPGGGSISAYVGALGAALGTMVANLSAAKRGWDDKISHFSNWAEKGQSISSTLLYLVDEDTAAFNQIIDAIRLPKESEEEAQLRKTSILEATKYAIEVPLKVMKAASESFDLLDAMVADGNPNSISDAGVGALCAYTAIHGAYLNVLINCKGISDKQFAKEKSSLAQKLLDSAVVRREQVLSAIHKVIND